MSTGGIVGTPFAAPPPKDTEGDDDYLKSMKPKKLWEQEVHDEQGRRRFHGAFTGGFSAGYYNSVGSKEGWTPATFTSSRSNRAGAVQQRPEDFMDEEDDASLGRELKARTQFDTFGKRIHDEARAASEDALGALLTGRDGSTGVRAPAIPGPVIDELIVPSSQPIGMQLLAAMGWREGQGIGPRAKRKDNKQAVAGDGHDSEGEDPHAAGFTFAPKNASVFSVTPKNDVHGLGYDPHVDAPEFKRRAPTDDSEDTPRVMTISHALVTGKAGGGFGTGVLSDDEDFDRLGGDVDVYTGDTRTGYYRSLGDEDEDETAAKGKATKTRDDHHKPVTKLGKATKDLPGFVRSSTVRVEDKVYTLPPVPKDFKPLHVFSTEEDAEFVRLRALVGATVPGAKSHLPMNAQSRALMLGEKPVIVTPTASQLPQSNRHAEAAVVAESRFVSSSAPSSLYVAPDAGVGGLMSKLEFESRFTKASSEDSDSAALPPDKPITREVTEWIPDRVLCRRFNVPDPFAGQHVPQTSSSHANGPGSTSKASGKFTDTSVDLFALPSFAGLAGVPAKAPEKASEGPVAEAEAVPIRPPVDLFKSIFEPSDSDEDT